MRLPSPNEIAALARQRIPWRLPKLSMAQWIWVGAGVALALLLTWLLWPRTQLVDAAAIDRGPVRHDVVDQGRTRIHDVYDIVAPVGGEVQRIELEPGDVVARGDIVATILPADPALLDARVAAEAAAAISAAQAAVAAAEADLQLAERDRQRVGLLHAQSFASQAALDAATANLRAARAEVTARRADLVRARAAASSPSARARVATPVRSPASGRVLQRFQQSETVVPAGAPLLEVGDPGAVEVVAEFLSQDAVLMRPGAPAMIEGWGGADAIPARVFRIEPYARTKISALGVEEQRVNVIVHLEHPQSAPPLGHGFRVDVRVVISQAANALRVPTDALVRDGANWAVFRIVGGRARLTPVTLGDGGQDYRIVSAGLRVGETVVLFPGDALRDGARVRARPARSRQ
jgi:HlyD family secretion protein